MILTWYVYQTDIWKFSISSWYIDAVLNFTYDHDLEIQSELYICSTKVTNIYEEYTHDTKLDVS